MRISAVSVLALLVLAACATPRPSHYAYAPPPPPEPAPRSQLHAYMPPPAPRTVETAPRPVKPIGAGVLTARNVEPYIDSEENELRSALHGTGILVARQGNDVVINMRSDALFAPGSTDLSGRAGQSVEEIGFVARKYDSTEIRVNGYTDTAGSPERNLDVSQSRATAIAKALVDGGVDAKRVVAHGFGEKGLRIPTGEGVNEPRNRRIEIRIMPIMRG